MDEYIPWFNWVYRGVYASLNLNELNNKITNKNLMTSEYLNDIGQIYVYTIQILQDE